MLATPSFAVTNGATFSGNSRAAILNGSLNFTSSTSSRFIGQITGGASTVTLNNAAATLTLSGSNAYGGATTVSAGLLAAAALNTLSPNSDITVSGGTLDASAATPGRSSHAHAWAASEP